MFLVNLLWFVMALVTTKVLRVASRDTHNTVSASDACRVSYELAIRTALGEDSHHLVFGRKDFVVPLKRLNRSYVRRHL